MFSFFRYEKIVIEEHMKSLDKDKLAFKIN